MKILFDINGAKKFWRMAAAALAVVASLAFASCSDMISDGQSPSLIAPTQSVSGGEAMIALSLGLENTQSADGAFEISKTVAPTSYGNTEISTLSDIRLYAKLSSSAAALGTSDTLLASWDNCSKMDSEPYAQSMAAGTYDFMLTAKKCGALMSQTLPNKSLAAGTTTTLSFTSLSADANGAQVGVAEVNLNYSSVGEAFKKYVSATEPCATLSITLDSALVAASALPTISFKYVSGKDDAGNSYSIGNSAASFVSVPISAGFHILTFTFKAADQSVFVYPVSVFIQTGCLSKSTLYPFNSAQEVAKASGGQSHAVTYNSNTASAVTATQTFYSGSSIADAEALGFEAPAGKRFKCWATSSDGTGTSYAAGGKPTLDGDITLYAQWGSFTKVTYFLNTQNGTDAYIQQYENGNSLTELATAFPTYAASSYASNYTFCGWDTSADGSGTRYAAGASPTFGEDAVLYAQWCGAKYGGSGTYKDYYKVSSANEWNAVMGAPFANQTAGTISVDVYFTNSIDKPAVALTKDKIFAGNVFGSYIYEISNIGGALFDQVAEGAKFSSVILTVGSVCSANKGTIESVTVKNTSFTGKSAIANENASTGTIKNCSVYNCTVTGSGSCAGAICGVNNGTIEDCNVTSSKVDGKTNSVQYTGGFCGWNKGRVLASSSTSSKVDIELLGNDASEARYGYVIGKNDGTVSVDVTSAKSETTTKPEITFDGQTYYAFTLTRTAKVTVTVTDGNDWGKSDCAISKYTDWSKTDIAHVQDVDETSKTFSGGYLEKGTYYIILHENYALGKGHAAVSWKAE